jgi:iron complex outermembrane receptor protein
MRFLLLFVPLSLTANISQAADLSKSIPSVIVTAEKKDSSSFTAHPGFIITREQIAATGVTTLAHALQDLGGVQLQDISGTGSQVLLSMRGFGANASSNTLMLVNGIPLTNPDMAPPDLNSIPLAEIEYIEIISGSESVLYGDQAVGGIINIITHKDSDNPIGLSCSTGSYHQHNCMASVYHRFDLMDFNLNLANNHTDNYRDHNNYDQSLLSGGISHTYQTGRINFDYTIASEKMLYPGALTKSQVEANRRQAANTTDFFRDTNGLFHLQSQQNIYTQWRLTTDLSLRTMHGDGVLFSSFKQSRSSGFLKPQLDGMIGKIRLKSGMDFQTDQYRLSSLLGTTKDTLEKYGIYFLASMPVNDRLAFEIGARGAQQDSTLTSLTASHFVSRAAASTIGTTYLPGPDVKLYLRRAESFRFPKADENSSTPPGINSLRTQRGAAYEAGAEIIREAYSGKLQIYQLNLEDEITFDPTQTPSHPFGTNRNLDPTVRRGLIISGKKTITRDITVNGQYNHVNARFQSGANSGNRIPLVSENIMRAGISYKLAQHWNFYSEAIFTGNQYPDSDDANVAGKIGGYTVYNLNLRFVYAQFSASLHFNNIFNKYYYLYTVYQPAIQSEFFYPAPGRNITLTMNYAFA